MNKIDQYELISLKHKVEEFVNAWVDNSTIEKISMHYEIGETFKKHGYEKNWMLHNKYYKYLYAYASICDDIIHPLEIGTQTGAGIATILSGRDFDDNFLGTTCDVNISHVSQKVFEDNQINVVKLLTPESCVEQKFLNHDFIFVDAGHDGEIEFKIHQRLISLGWNGIVLWDDINIDDRMRKFWNKINNPKIETDWHDECGFGIVSYE